MLLRELSLAAAAAVIATAAPLTAQAHGRHLSFAPKVMWSWYLTKAAPAYVANHRIEVRTDPDPNSPTTMVLHRGDTMEAAGQTEDGWVALAENGVVRGYAFTGVMTPLWNTEVASLR
jgi:hypothetical protein